MRIRVLASLALVLASGCPAEQRADRPVNVQRNEKDPAMQNPMQPSGPAGKQANMIDGPALEPAGPLLEWLNKNAKGEGGKRRRFRLPVAVHFEDQDRLAFGAVHIGRSLSAPAGAIQLSLDDTGLAMPLLPSVASKCPKDAPGCVLLLEGYWGPLVPGGPPDISMPGEPKRWPFSVLKVHGLVDGASQDARAQVEG